MLDLYNKKYDRETLKNNIYNVKLIDILKTQIIDISFAVRYLLNNKYQINNYDFITAPLIIKYQPHITYEQLQHAILEYESDDDSLFDFETVSNSS